MSDVQTADHGSLLLNYPAESGETHGQQTGENKFYIIIISTCSIQVKYCRTANIDGGKF